MKNKVPLDWRKRHKTLLHIVEGDERTYIHPYSYYGDYMDRHKNRRQFLYTLDLPPHQQMGQVCEPYSFWPDTEAKIKLKRWWNIVREYWRLLKNPITNEFDFIRFTAKINSGRFIWCAEIYRGPGISVPGTLIPSNSGSNLTDTVYLTPSQEWIKQKLQDWLLRKRGLNDTCVTQDNNGTFVFFHDWERNSYLKWEKTQIELGRRIGFLSSLDT